MTIPVKQQVQSRNDLAWAIAVGGIGIIAFAALLMIVWHFAATLFLIFAGILFGVFLDALTSMLHRVTGGPHAVRLVLVCVMLAAMLSGVLMLGGGTIAQQATLLSNTIKSQIGNVKDFLEERGVDTSFLDLSAVPATSDNPATPPHLPSAGAIASGGGAIVSQTLRLVLGAIGAVGNFFIVLFLGVALAAQPRIYRQGLLRQIPARHRDRATIIVDKIGTLLQRWLMAQIITMTAVFAVTAIGLTFIGIPGAFILGIQAGLLAFVPTIGALLGGLIILLASIASGWFAVLSAFLLFLGVHVLESYILTPLIQREAMEIPPATLFAFQILLGTVFGLWGLALALPLMAIIKVTLNNFRASPPAEAPAQTGP